MAHTLFVTRMVMCRICGRYIPYRTTTFAKMIKPYLALILNGEPGMLLRNTKLNVYPYSL